MKKIEYQQPKAKTVKLAGRTNLCEISSGTANLASETERPYEDEFVW